MCEDLTSPSSPIHNWFGIAAKRRLEIFGIFALVLIGATIPAARLSAQTATPVTVPTWRYDLTHSGANENETALTLANVNVNSFGKLFALKVDGSVYAQPLYIPGLTMSDGNVHNVLFVATENDSIYAFDADSNGGADANPIWQISLLTAAHGAGAGATAVPYKDTGSPDIAPVIGITGTPAINTATNTMYVVAVTKENGVYHSRLHAINILNGTEQPNSPVEITATVAGTGNGSSGGQLSFDPLWANQRAALDFYNGHVYIGYAAHGDLGPYHGWLFAYDGTTLAQTAVICLSPNGLGSGIWSSGAGMPIDEDAPGGRMFVVTGNGPHTPNVKFPYSGSTGYGESVVDFSLANGGLTATDDFTSYNYAALNDGDLDLGAGGLLMVPDQQGDHPHLLVVAGKEARLLVLDRDNLGGYAPGGSSNTNALQDITNQIKGCWCTPAYWNKKLYIWTENDVAKEFDLDGGVMSSTPLDQATINSAFPSPTFSISSNGTQEGIAWAVRADQFNTHGPLVLYAWDANDLSDVIYESDTNSKRDAGGPANRFSTPVVTNGKVYVAANGEVDVYGLFNGEPNAAAPVISPNGGTFAASQSVQLSTSTAAASIYYTLDGSTPTPASTLYNGPITISTDTTLKAIASATGYVQSGVSSATFTFSTQTPLPTFAPAGGSYQTAQQVTIADTDANAKIYYTTDGSTPSASSLLYSGPIQVAVSKTIKAIAIDPSLNSSNVVTAAYVIQAGGESIDFGNGFSVTTGLTLNGSAVATNDTRLQLTNGGLQEASSVFWNTPINIQSFSTDFEFQISAAQGNGFTFTIQNVGATALGSDAAGLGYQGIAKSVAIKFNFNDYQGEGSDSTGIYTDGQAPTMPTVDLTPSGIQLASSDGIDAHVTYDGTTLTLTLHDLVNNDNFTMSQAINIPQIVGGNTAYVGFTGGSGDESSSQKLLNWVYTTQAVPPAFSPVAGTYSTTQNVSLSSATADAAIYYTTDGNTPDAGSKTYSNPIPVTASETIKAIAVSPTMGTSSVETAAYAIQAGGGSPTFSLSSTSAASIAQGSSTSSTITITPGGGFTGMVMLSCAVTAEPSGATNMPTCGVSQPAAISGTNAVTSTLTVNTQAATSAGSYTITVTGTSGTVVETTTVPVTINAAPAFSVAGTAASVASPGGTATSTVTITPSAGFTGTVTVTCAVTAGPAGAIDPPTCSATQPPAISGTAAVTSTITINTTAASSATRHNPLRQIFGFGGGGTLAAFLFLCVPFRRRKWPTLFGLLILLVVSGAAIGCGGGSSNGLGSPSGPSNSGTTAGTYTITVTGTSGTTSATTTFTVSVG